MMTLISQAALFAGPGQPWQFKSLPLPLARDSEILVRVLLCTLCGSDLHSILGRRNTPVPAVLGHEIVGQIVAMGPQAPTRDQQGAELKIGDRVCWAITTHCGSCHYCQRQLPQKCLNGSKYGHHRVPEDGFWQGGLAQHCLLTSGTDIFRLPESISLEAAAPLSCATATIAAAIRIADIQPNESILVVGAGLLGLTACAFARQRRPKLVVCVESDPARQEVARRFGADAVADACQSISQCTELPAGEITHGFDCIIECTGNNAATLQALERLRLGGRMVLVGAVYPSEPVPLVLEQIVRRHVTIHGVHNYRSEDLAAAIDFMADAEKRFPFADLVHPSFRLQEIESAIDAAQDRRNIRVAIRP